MDYFDEIERENYFIYDNGRPCICQNKKGEFISSEIIEEILNTLLEKRRGILKVLDYESRPLAYVTIKGQISQIEEIKEILLGGKKKCKKKMQKKLNKPTKIFLIDMELMLHDLIVDIMERYGYDLEQAKGLIFGVIEIVTDEIQNEVV